MRAADDARRRDWIATTAVRLQQSKLRFAAASQGQPEASQLQAGTVTAARMSAHMLQQRPAASQQQAEKALEQQAQQQPHCNAVHGAKTKRREQEQSIVAAAAAAAPQQQRQPAKPQQLPLLPQPARASRADVQHVLGQMPLTGRAPEQLKGTSSDQQQSRAAQPPRLVRLGPVTDPAQDQRQTEQQHEWPDSRPTAPMPTVVRSAPPPRPPSASPVTGLAATVSVENRPTEGGAVSTSAAGMGGQPSAAEPLPSSSFHTELPASVTVLVQQVFGVAPGVAEAVAEYMSSECVTSFDDVQWVRWVVQPQRGAVALLAKPAVDALFIPLLPATCPCTQLDQKHMLETLLPAGMTRCLFK